MRRYRMVAAIMTFLAVVVVLKAGYIMTVQKTYWQTVAAKVRLDSVLVNPLRGNILAAGNQRLACNLPEYRVYMDFQAIRDSKCDTLWHDSLGRPTKDLLALCEGLHRVFPSRSAKAFLDSLEAAYAYIDSKGRRKRCYPIWKRRIDYMTYKQLKELPIFCLGPYRSGFSGVELMVRNRPYGSLASPLDVFVGQRIFVGPDVVLKPLLEREVVCIAAKQGHCGMTMGVVEGRKDCKTLCLNDLSSRIVVRDTDLADYSPINEYVGAPAAEQHVANQNAHGQR